MKKKKIVAITASAIMAASLLGGCGGGSGKGDSTNLASGEMKRADVQEMTYVYSDDIEDWNYLTTTSHTPGMTLDTLVEYDNYGICQPCLADSWERSDDGLTWT